MPGRPRLAHRRTARREPGGGPPSHRRSLTPPDLLAACESWGAQIEGALAADYSAVLAVRLPDGTPAVAKLPPPFDESRFEGDALVAWNGQGAVRLLDRHVNGALLLERAEPATIAGDDSAVATCLASLWIDPPAGVDWLRADEQRHRWAATIDRWREAVGPALADAAIAVLHEGLGDDTTLLHGDGHHGNILDGGHRGWLAIDPQPIVGPPAMDLACALWNGPGGPIDRRIDVVAGVAGVDRRDLRRLAVARAVLCAAWVFDDGENADFASRALTVAAELTR